MSALPYHSVAECRNIHSRLSILDGLMSAGVFAGGVEATKARLRGYSNGEYLCKEFDYYTKGTNCCTCFWKVLWDNMPKALRGEGKADLQDYCIFSVEGPRSTLEDDDVLNRLFSQKTDPIRDYAYYEEDIDDDNVRVHIVVKGKVRPRTLKRIFESLQVNENPTTYVGITAILNHPEVIKHGMNDFSHTY